jgi:2-haloacid dehalogenase/putative hydrolase of the HAD superfamily
MQKTFDLITFDCYGTLIDWEGGIVRAFQSEAGKDGLALQAPEIIEAYMIEEPLVESGSYRPYREILAQTAVRVARRLGWTIDERRAEFLPASLPSWIPFADTNPALERLASRFKLGILSNIDDDLLAKTLNHLTAGFEIIVTAAQVRSYKPGHAHFQEALSRAKGKRILHAAQSYFHDVVPCRALGIPVAWVNRKGEAVPERGPAPNTGIRTLKELADLVASD